MISTITPGASRLLDLAIRALGLKTDRALADRCHITPPAISKMRTGSLPIGASMLLRLHDETGISLDKLRDAGGIASLTTAGRSRREA
jgi:transcriptional regulator with XRE-family HTH domain